ncbi:MAG: hypothetical protein RMY62_018700 [Nostoc sp. ZfuVER08]|uniref:Uncharacterized protein n=1 Tax=Nostoc punctiforme FACHB-252 TaxID=1357509 RepID=A0ABR8H9C9_NOSPU|nr:hypothetical protein [Nostoc punctiforme]MBD2612221.1 hypothetical protein [Nostoc punctiforme FACHB-252]MDZ8013925.1 hypothetical protein [Nostoc sp. ZfuVER08]
MKSFFSSQSSKFSLMMTFCTFGVSIFNIPALASPDEVCIKTSSGQVVCGKPVQSPNSSSQKPDSDETIQTGVYDNYILDLKSCRRKQRGLNCTLFLSSNEDRIFDLYTNNNRIVDNEGTEYRPNTIQVGKNMAGKGGVIKMNFVKNIKYKAVIIFDDIPTSTPYISLLEIVPGYFIRGEPPKFRNIPIINLDGSFAPVPDTPKPRVSQPSSNNNPIPKPKVCLPVVGCL